MRYEIKRLSSGWLISIGGKAINFVIDIDEAFPFIVAHAKNNPPPYSIEQLRKAQNIHADVA